MPFEGERFVLRQEVDAAQSRVQTVAEREVDDAVDSAERDRRFGPISRKGVKPLPDAAREDDRKRVAQQVFR